MSESTSKEKMELPLREDIIDPNMRDYSNERFFIKKDEEARKFFETPGVLEQLEKLMNKK